MKADKKNILSFSLAKLLCLLFSFNGFVVFSQNQQDTISQPASNVQVDSVKILELEAKANRIKDSIRDIHLEVLSNINCDLSNSWTINLKLNDASEEGYKSNAIKSYLFTYKTRKDGRNSGVIMNFYDIKFKDTVLIDKAPNHSSIEAHFFYTKNYIVYVNHGKNVNDVYDSYMPILIEELKTFFESNKETL